MPVLAFTLDGRPVAAPFEPGDSALDVLRDALGATWVKRGCGQGSCGACTVLLDGKARPTCALPAERLAGRTVLTTAGLDPAEQALFVRAFAEEGGFQCGFCTPGLVLRAKTMLDADPAPDRAAIRRALGGHVCRCTGWEGVIRAIARVAVLRRGEDPEAPPAGGPRWQARALILGQQPFIGDVGVPGMLHGALVFVPAPRCRLLAVDPSPALALPGVRAVATAADVPGERYLGLLRPDWPPLLPVGAESGCAGDVVAAVAADTPRLAREAARRVRVEVEVLAPVLDLEQAARDPAMILARSTIRRGDAEAALAHSAAVVRETFRTQRVDHAFLEPEAALCRPLPDGRLHLLSCGQGVFDDRRQLARFLALPEERVVVELGGAGGAFGGREDLSVQPHACLLAVHTGRPVRVVLPMEDAIRLRPKRHPFVLHYALGADAEGRITALRATILGDTGGHASVGEKVLERAAGHAGGPYAIPVADVEALTVRTHNPVSGAMRGFGANQAAFALEGCIERLAERLGFDPFAIRLRNAARPGDRLITGQRVGDDAGLVATLEALRPHWERARAEGRAVGLACGLKNVGLGNGYPEQGRIELAVEAPDRIVIATGFTEMGQGHFSVLRQQAARLTGLPIGHFEVRATTEAPVDVGMTTSSRATFLGVRGLMAAAEALVAALAGGSPEALVGRRFLGVWEAPATHPPEADVAEPVTHWAWAWASQMAVLDGEGRLERIVAAHDVGRALDPLACRGQVEGGVHMGAGYALGEELAVAGGVPDPSYRRLGVLPARRSPEVEVLLVEVPSEHGPGGARGVGEIALVPTAPAIAHAVHAFDGSWPTALPMRASPAGRKARG